MATKGNYAGEHILTEIGNISRDQVTVSGGDYPPGKVLGKITATDVYVEHDPAAADGSQTASAILYSKVNAQAADAKGVVSARLTEVRANDLVWKDGISDPEKAVAIEQLAQTHIIVR